MTTPEIRGIYVFDVRQHAILGKYRETKYCVCVSIGGGLYLVINTRSNPDYDDFQIRASNYDFLNSEDRYLGCDALFELDAVKILRKVGVLNDFDAKIVYEKIRASTSISDETIQKVLSELWALFRM